MSENSAHHVALTQPLRCARALPPALLSHSTGDYRPQVLAQHHRQSPLQWSANLAPRAIDSANYGRIRQLGIRQHSRSTVSSDSRIRRFLGILGTPRYSCPRKFSSRCKPIMQEIYVLVPWLQLHHISLNVVYIHSEFNLADPARRRRGADLWSFLPRTQHFIMLHVQNHFNMRPDTDSDGKILHSSIRASIHGVQRASNRLGCSASAMAQPSFVSLTFSARQDDRIQSTRGAHLSPLAPAVMVRQIRNLQSLLHISASGSQMCSTTPPRQSRTSSTSRPRFAGNGLRLVVINETYRKCKLLSCIGHDATISCQGQILQVSFQDLLGFSRFQLS